MKVDLFHVCLFEVEMLSTGSHELFGVPVVIVDYNYVVDMVSVSSLDFLGNSSV